MMLSPSVKKKIIPLVFSGFNVFLLELTHLRNIILCCKVFFFVD